YIKWQLKQRFIPRLEDILQVPCYGTIFSQRVPIEDLNVVYADMSDIIAYRVQKRNLTEWINRRIQETEDSIFQNKVPIGEVSGLCKYCRFQTRCFNDGSGLTDKPLSVPRS